MMMTTRTYEAWSMSILEKTKYMFMYQHQCLLLFSLFKEDVSTSCSIASNNKMNNKEWIVKIIEGFSQGIIYVLSWHLSEEMEENH